MNEKKNLRNKILIFSTLIIIFVVCGIIYIIQNPQREQLVTETPIPFVCATETSDENENGKEIFNANCAACHKRNLENNILEEGVKKFKSGKDFYFFVKNEDSLFTRSKNAKTVTNEFFEGDFNHKFNLTESQVTDLKDYLK